MVQSGDRIYADLGSLASYLGKAVLNGRANVASAKFGCNIYIRTSDAALLDTLSNSIFILIGCEIASKS